MADDIGNLLAFGVQQERPDIQTAKGLNFFTADLTPAFTRRAVTGLNNLLATQRRTLPQDDFAALACLRDTLAETLASGKPYEGRLADYE